MIEIIKKGTKRKETCKECGCVFSFDYDVDAQSEDNRPIGGYRIYVNCPQCHARIYLEQTK